MQDTPDPTCDFGHDPVLPSSQASRMRTRRAAAMERAIAAVSSESPVPEMTQLVGPLDMHIDLIVVLIHNCDFQLLAIWRATCRALFTVVAAHLRGRYESCLSRFVDDIPTFDRILSGLGAIVSGSVALRYFLPGETWKSGDMDVYVPDMTYDSFIAAVTDKHGLQFTLIPRKNRQTPAPGTSEAGGQTGSLADRDGDDPMDGGAMGTPAPAPAPNDAGWTPSMFAGLLEVRQFRTRTGERIDVIRAPGNNPIVAINRFWSSLVMNFLHPDACVCGFPKTTLSRVGMLKPDLTPQDLRAVQKYEAREFKVISAAWRTGADYWDSIFFGRPKAMITPFRLDIADDFPELPIASTERGWQLNPSWPFSVLTSLYVPPGSPK